MRFWKFQNFCHVNGALVLFFHSFTLFKMEDNLKTPGRVTVIL